MVFLDYLSEVFKQEFLLTGFKECCLPFCGKECKKSFSSNKYSLEFGQCDCIKYALDRCVVIFSSYATENASIGTAPSIFLIFVNSHLTGLILYVNDLKKLKASMFFNFGISCDFLFLFY